MKIGTRQLAVAALAILILMAGRVWAQEEEQAKTPQQVVTEFADALAVYTFVYYFSGKEFPRELLSDDSQKVMYELYEEAVEPLMAWLAFPRLMPVADISPGQIPLGHPEALLVAHRPGEQKRRGDDAHQQRDDHDELDHHRSASPPPVLSGLSYHAVSIPHRSGQCLKYRLANSGVML